MIKIKQSKTADTRTCDYSNVTRDQLFESSVQHIDDVKLGLDFFSRMIKFAALFHDNDKLSDIEHFHSDFLTGFKETGWLENHYRLSRHHLNQKDGLPEDVNLIDVIEMIVDCIMAGMARTSSVYPLEISPAVLMLAFKNTVNLLQNEVVVEKE